MSCYLHGVLRVSILKDHSLLNFLIVTFQLFNVLTEAQHLLLNCVEFVEMILERSLLQRNRGDGVEVAFHPLTDLGWPSVQTGSGGARCSADESSPAAASSRASEPAASRPTTCGLCPVGNINHHQLLLLWAMSCGQHQSSSITVMALLCIFVFFFI